MSKMKYSCGVSKKRLQRMLSLEARDAKKLYDRICIRVNKTDGETITLGDVCKSEGISYKELLCGEGIIDSDEMDKDSEISIPAEIKKTSSYVTIEDEEITLEEILNKLEVTPQGKIEAKEKKLVIKVLKKAKKK